MKFKWNKTILNGLKQCGSHGCCGGGGGDGNVILLVRIQIAFFSNLCHPLFFIFQSINFTDPFYTPPVVVVTPKQGYINNHSDPPLSQCSAITAWVEVRCQCYTCSWTCSKVVRGRHYVYDCDLAGLENKIDLTNGNKRNISFGSLAEMVKC